MPDKYPSMRALYADPMNVEGTTYGKRRKRHEWIQLVEAQAIDNPETEKVVLAIHGGGIEGGTSEIALAVAGFHPATFAQATDGLGFHDLWIFEGLLSSCNSNLQGIYCFCCRLSFNNNAAMFCKPIFSLHSKGPYG